MKRPRSSSAVAGVLKSTPRDVSDRRTRPAATKTAQAAAPTHSQPAAARPTFEEARLLPERLIDWLFAPNESAVSFIARLHQQQALHVSGRKPTYYCPDPSAPASLWVDWSTERMLQAARERPLQFGTDVNAVRYDPALKKRVPYQTSGPLPEALMRELMASGWSLRFLRPQEHSPLVSALIAVLEEAMQSFGGANTYWTPGGSQGFAPHYDDVDVFLLQLEGGKRWRLYDPPAPVDVLSRHSSSDYLPEELGPLKCEMVLRPGDLLYMPRGTVHQGDTYGLTEHSLHITISVDQMHTWADLMHAIARRGIETCAANDVRWRRAVPRGWWWALGDMSSKDFAHNFFGGADHAKSDRPARARLLADVRGLMGELSAAMATSTAIDAGADEYAKEVLHKRQPPPARTEPAQPAASHAPSPPKITLSSAIRPRGAGCARITTVVPGEVQVFHSGGNATICFGQPLGHLRFEDCFAQALALVITSYPTPVRLRDLPLPEFADEDRVENALMLGQSLLDSGAFELVEDA